jgi:hypothetical protein
MASNRRQILEAVRERLQAILRSGGYHTDAGALVFLGEAPNLGPDDPAQAIAILVDDDRVIGVKTQVQIELPVSIAALVRADLDTPWLMVEDVLADIKRAIEVPDRQLGLGRIVTSRIERGTTRTLERQDGTNVVGATVTYTIPYVEVWGGETEDS